MNKMKNILYITDSGFDTNNPTQHLQITIIKDLLKNGYSVHFIFSYEKKQKYIPRELYKLEHLTYETVKRRRANKKNFILRYIFGLLFSLSGICKIKIAQNKSSVIILQSSATSIFTMTILKLFNKKPIIYNEYDIFPGEIYQNGTLKYKIIYNILQIIQNQVYRMSNKIITLSPDTKSTLLKIGVRESKIAIIPTWYDETNILPVEKNSNKFIKKYNIQQEKFIVQFAGTLGYVFDYLLVLNVAEELKNNNDIEFHMIGDGAYKNEFYNEARRRRLDNIKFFPWQPRDLLSDIYSSASISIIPLRPGVIYVAFPSKAPLLMAVNRVAIFYVEEESEFYKMINENKIGIAISHRNPEKVASAIIWLKENKSELLEMERKANEYSYKKYSSNVNTKKLINIIEKLNHCGLN